jgi:hypothetical protein
LIKRDNEKKSSPGTFESARWTTSISPQLGLVDGEQLSAIVERKFLGNRARRNGSTFFVTSGR